MLERCTKDRGDAPSPVDSHADLQRAVKTLADMARHRLPIGAQLAQVAVDAFAGAWLRCEATLPYCGELDDAAADPPFALLSVVTCLAERLPPAERRHSATAPAAQPPDRMPVFTLAPSLLGRYRQLQSCNRFLHLKTEFTKRHNVSDGGGGQRATALVKEGSATEAILQKGMYWEDALTKLIKTSPAPACLAPPGRELPGDATRVRDLALEAFLAAVQPGSDKCACGHTVETRLGDDLREKRHADPACTYQLRLLEISKHALLHEQPGVCLYQAKFEVPSELYAKCGLNPDVLRFTNFQPDYVFVLPGERPGLRELAIVDAKASAHVKVAHRVQVAAYAWALEGLMKQGRVSTTSRVADVGAIWRPGCAAPDVFPLAEPVRQHEEALCGPLSTTVLTREAYAKSLEGGASSLAHGQDWQLRSSCASCEFLAQCRGEAVNPRKLSSVPGLGPASAAALRDIADVEDVPGLVGWLRDADTPAKVQAALRDPKLRSSTAALAALAPAGLADAAPEAPLDERVRQAAASDTPFSPRLQAALEGRVVVRPGAICTTLPAPQDRSGPAEDIVCVSLLSDPTTGEAYAWAVQTFTAQPGGSLLAGTATRPAVAVVPREQFDAAAAYEPPPPADVLELRAKDAAAEAASPGDITLGRGLALRRGLVAELHAALSGPSTRLACAVMLDGNERAAVLSLLFSVATSSLAAEADLREPAQCCLFACMDARLVAASRAVGLDAAAEKTEAWERFRQLHAADAPFLAALLPALPTLLELPALGFVTLADVARHVAAAAPALQQQGDRAVALRNFILGPDASCGRGDSLDATVGSLDVDAAYRDWCARAVGGEPRVAELVVRRCRLAAATLDGLRALLHAAGGARQYLPLSAARRGAAMRVQPFESAACGRAALFKCLELRAAGAASRAERARPLATRLRKGKTLLLRVIAIGPGSKSNSRNITCEVVPEAQGGTPQTAADKLLQPAARKYAHWLVAPLTRDGLLSTLRFPEAALAHVSGKKAGYSGAALWEAFPQEAHPLRASLLMGALHPEEVKPDDAPRTTQQPAKVTLCLCRGPLRDVGSRYTALEPDTHCAVGAMLLLFVRETDPNGLRVAQHARARVDCPADWRQNLQPRCEVIARGVSGFGDCVALYGGLDGDGNAVLTVVASNIAQLAEPATVHAPLSKVALRYSLFRTLFDRDAEPGVLLPSDFDPAVASPAGAWACGADAQFLKPMVLMQSPNALAEVLSIYSTYFTPTASQRESFARVVMHRLSAVWGPPGAGKTHFSAGMLLALHLAYLRASAPLRVLVCSQTKAATRVLLRKLSDEAAKLVQLGVLDAASFKLFTTDEDGVSPHDSTELVPIEEAPNAATLWSSKHCVVGATVWRANTRFAASADAREGSIAPPKFDLILVDEASQLLACDAMMVVDLLDPFSGRLVAVGDHLQMPPVIRGTGYPVGTAGCPSPAASLLEAVRGALKAGGPAAAAHAVSCTLLDNHRMAPQLACFCAAPEGIYPAGFVDCSTTQPPCPCRSRGRGRRLPLRADAEAGLHVPWLRRALNPAAELVVVRLPGADDAEEAAAAAALLKAACEHWEHKPKFCDEAFVVAPHHRQIALLQKALEWDPLLNRGQMSISTVETVQGREAELVLVLYALTCPDTIAAEADFLYSLERLNVALTRARQKAVLFITRAVASPDARAAAAAASPAADEGLAFLRRATAFSRRRGWYLRLRSRENDSETDDGADGGFEEDSDPDSDDEGARPPSLPGWPAQEADPPFGDSPRRMHAAHSDDGAASAEDGHASGAGDDGDDVMHADPYAEERSQELALHVQTSASLEDYEEAYEAPAAAGGASAGDASLRSSQRPFPPPSLSGSLDASPPPSQQPRLRRAPGSAPPGAHVPPESVGFSPPGVLPAPPHTVDGSHLRARQGPGGARSAAPPQRGSTMFDAVDLRTPVPSLSDPVEEADDSDDDGVMLVE